MTTKTVVTHVLAGVVGFFTIATLIAGVAFIPIFYQCRISESAACFYEPGLTPEKVYAEAKPRTSN